MTEQCCENCQHFQPTMQLGIKPRCELVGLWTLPTHFCKQHISPQHTDAEWFELYGRCEQMYHELRYITYSDKIQQLTDVTHRFLLAKSASHNSTLTESLWHDMQLAVKP